MNEKDASRLLDHAWRYFELHASQRMSLFNFFLVLSGLASAGIAAALTAAEPLTGVAGVLGLLLALISLVFHKLDQRVCFLMKQSELVSGRAEAVLFQSSDCLFGREPERTCEATKQGNRLTRLWTYGNSFRQVFRIMGAVGVLTAGYSVVWLGI